MDLTNVLAGAVASGAVAGVAAAVTDGRATILQATAGVTAIGGAAAVTAETVFYIASMTKPVTSVAALQLVEQGRLSLDADLAGLLPELGRLQVLEDGVLRPARQAMTLRHLLTHTSGFGYPFSSPELTAYMAMHDIKPAPGTLASLQAPLLFEPGARWEYGISTDWVGRAVEAASGQKLDDYFAKHVTGPLGMDSTGFAPGPENRAVMHQRQADGGLRALPPSPAKAEFCSGGGGLYSTVGDYQKFMRMILQGGAGIISAASVAALSVNQVGGLRAGVIRAANPAVMAGADPFPGQDSKWSFGFNINPQPGPMGRSAGSLSWAGIANTYFWIDPARDLAGVILMQLLPSGDLAAIKTYMQFERAVYAALR